MQVAAEERAQIATGALGRQERLADQKASGAERLPPRLASIFNGIFGDER